MNLRLRQHPSQWVSQQYQHEHTWHSQCVQLLTTSVCDTGMHSTPKGMSRSPRGLPYLLTWTYPLPSHCKGALVDPKVITILFADMLPHTIIAAMLTHITVVEQSRCLRWSTSRRSAQDGSHQNTERCPAHICMLP